MLINLYLELNLSRAYGISLQSLTLFSTALCDRY